MPMSDRQSSDSEQGGIWGPKQRGLSVGLLLTVSFSAFEALAVATVLPTAVAEIGGLDLYGWVFSVFMLANLVGIVTAGRSADLHGPARAFAAGVVLFVLGLVWAGLSPTMSSVVAARSLQGLGAGAIGAVAYVAIKRAYSPEARPKMLALMSTAWVVPGLVGPALAGVMADFLGWRWVFLGLAPLSLLAAGFAFAPLRSLRPSPASGESESEADFEGDDLIGKRSKAPARWKVFLQDPRSLSIGLAGGAGLFLFGLGDGFGLWAVLLSLIGLAISLPALQGLLPPGTLRARAGLPAAVAVIGVLGFTFFGAETFIPLALTEIHGLPASLAGLPLSVGTIFWTTGAWIQAREASRRSRRALIGLGLLGVGVGIAGTTLILLPSISYWLSGVAWSVAALGMGIAYSTTSLVILELAPAGEEGKASASLQLATNLGIAMGAGAGGAVVASMASGAGSLAHGIGLVDAIMLAGVVVGVVLSRGIPPRAQD